MIVKRELVKREFEEYTSHYNARDPKIALKIKHTFRVADLADRIAGSLALPEEDRDLAWLTGMLHDIGRFEQVRRYGTFLDAVSVNHAALSADILFHDGLIRRFLPENAEEKKQDGAEGLERTDGAGGTEGTENICGILEKAVRFHNALNLPEDLTERELLFCRLIRDADKTDILHIMCETPFEDIYGVSWEELQNSEISEEVFADIMGGRTVNRANSRTPLDYRIGHVALVNGLEFPESRKIVQSLGVVDRLLDIDCKKPVTAGQIEKIRERLNHI